MTAAALRLELRLRARSFVLAGIGLMAVATIAGEEERRILVNGLAAVTADWLQYLTLFHYYEGSEPLRNGVDPGHLAVLGAMTVLLLAVAAAGFRDRDLRG